MKNTDHIEYKTITDFSLPLYNELPDVGLYLKQVVRYINNCLQPYFGIVVTETMLSNYVKKHIISSPVKKQYDRDQIATFFFITLAKTVVSLEDIQTLLEIQKKSYSCQKAYEYVRQEFEAILLYVFGESENMPGQKNSDENKELLRNVIITIAHRLYLDYRFRELHFDDV